jgi:hypothetical protein
VRLLCGNEIYGATVSHQLTAERTGYQCRGGIGGEGGDSIVPAPHFTFCISAEIFAHTSKLSCLLCHVQLAQKISFSDSSSFQPVVLCFSFCGLFPHFLSSVLLSLSFPSSLFVCFSVSLILLHLKSTILRDLLPCNLQFELLTESLNKSHTKYTDKSSGRMFL